MCVREYLWIETEYGISESNAEVDIVVFTWVEKILPDRSTAQWTALRHKIYSLLLSMNVAERPENLEG